MATDFRMALEELLDKRGASADFLRDSLERLVQLLMEIEVSSQIGADRHERTPERVTHRNGYRERAWETRVDTINLRIPNCGREAISRACWSHGAAPRKRWWLSSRRPTYSASARARWTSWYKPWA